MAQNVTYADLRFMKAPPGNSVSSSSPEAASAAEDDAELTYENIHLAQTVDVRSHQGAEQSKVHWWSAWYLPLSLLGTCLFLLVTTIGLGVRYWQVSQQLQQASQAHAEERSRLSQQVSTKEETLGQRASELEGVQGQLEQARQELERMWQEKNNTQELLQQKENELARVKEELAKVEEQMQETKKKLNQTETALANIRLCEQTDCCPEEWLLYRGKCLFISRERKSWDESKRYCEQKSARLLITSSWDLWTTLNFLKNTDVQYWIGFQRRGYGREIHLEWLDGSPSEPWNGGYYDYSKNCGALRNGFKTIDKCSSANPWICEKAPRLPAQLSVVPL